MWPLRVKRKAGNTSANIVQYIIWPGRKIMSVINIFGNKTFPNVFGTITGMVGQVLFEKTELSNIKSKEVQVLKEERNYTLHFGLYNQLLPSTSTGSVEAFAANLKFEFTYVRNHSFTCLYKFIHKLTKKKEKELCFLTFNILYGYWFGNSLHGLSISL